MFTLKPGVASIIVLSLNCLITVPILLLGGWMIETFGLLFVLIIGFHLFFSFLPFYKNKWNVPNPFILFLFHFIFCIFTVVILVNLFPVKW